MEIQAHIDLLMSELVDLNNEVKTKKELVRKHSEILMYPKNIRIEHYSALVIIVVSYAVTRVFEDTGTT